MTVMRELAKEKRSGTVKKARDRTASEDEGEIRRSIAAQAQTASGTILKWVAEDRGQWKKTKRGGGGVGPLSGRHRKRVRITVHYGK